MSYSYATILIPCVSCTSFYSLLSCTGICHIRIMHSTFSSASCISLPVPGHHCNHCLKRMAGLKIELTNLPIGRQPLSLEPQHSQSWFCFTSTWKDHKQPIHLPWRIIYSYTSHAHFFLFRGTILLKSIKIKPSKSIYTPEQIVGVGFWERYIKKNVWNYMTSFLLQILNPYSHHSCYYKIQNSK